MNASWSARLWAMPAALIVHGLLLLFLAPWAGWGVWFFTVVALAALSLDEGWVPKKIGARFCRAAAAAYQVIVGAVVFLSWLFVLFHHPVTWFLIGMLSLLGLLLLILNLEPLAAVLAAAVISAAILTPTLAKLSSVFVMSLAAAVGIFFILAAAFSGTLRRVGRVNFLLFMVLASAMGTNDIFYHGLEFTTPQTVYPPGIRPLLKWSPHDFQQREKIGTALRFVERAPSGRYLIGGDLGVLVTDEHELRTLPLGPAGDNAAVDQKTMRAYLATRDGKLSLLEGGSLGLAAQLPLPRGALVTRLAPEGVYALDEWRWVGLYDPIKLSLRRSWRTWPVSDLIPDGQGGFFLSTLIGLIEHHQANEVVRKTWAVRCGIFHLMALDARNNRLFVSNMAATELLVFDTQSLRRVAEIKVPRGCRNLLWDDETQTLLAGGYFSGELLAFGGDLKPLGRVEAGFRLRAITADGSGKAMLASARGLLEIDIRRAFYGQ